MITLFALSAVPVESSADWTDWIQATIAFAALVVGVVSIFYTRNSLLNQEKHNKLSVRPVPYLRRGFYDNCIIVSLNNNGVGPLIISHITFRNSSETNNDLISFAGLSPSSLDFKYTSEFEGRSILPGDSLIIYELRGAPEDLNFRKERDRVKKNISSVILQLNFSDIYGDNFPEYSCDLSWFAR